MKKLLPVFALGLAISAYAANEKYETPGEGTVYSFADLSKIEDSGVKLVEENVYELTKDIDVVAADGLTVDNNATLRFGANILVRIYGSGNLAPADTASVVPSADGITPKGFQFLDNEKPCVVKHIRFEGAGIKSGAPYGLTVENCSFIEHNAKVGNYAVGFVASSINNAVRNCYFEKSNLSAIGSGSNVAAGTIIENNTFNDCSTAGRNYPVINQVVAGDNGGTVIRNNKLIGTGRTMPGAISISNMLTITGANDVLIEDNELTDFRYGINVYGYQSARVINNRIIDCHYETNANNGGSGITVYGATSYPATAYIQGNYIDGSLWGITAVLGANVNMGRVDVAETDPDYNPGGNTLKNNGNHGTADTDNGETTAFDPSIPYDLYNNTTNTIYAQNNTWGGADQSKKEIEKRIYHKNDNDSLGEVIFMTSDGSGLELTTEDVFAINVYADGSFKVDGVDADTTVTVYNVAGATLWSGKAGQTVNIGRRGLVVVAVGKVARRLAL